MEAVLSRLSCSLILASPPSLVNRTFRASRGSRDWIDTICNSLSISSSRDGYVFFTGDAVEEDVRFDFGDGAVTLGCAEAGEVELAHLFGLHSLCGEGAQATLEARVDLVLDERLGNREGETLGHRGEEMVLGFGFDAAALAGFEVIANALLEIGIALVVAELFGEIVVELGKNALLDGLDFDIVGDGFAGQLGLSVVRRIDDFELELLAGLGAAEGVSESLNRVFAADFDQRVFAADRFRLGGLGFGGAFGSSIGCGRGGVALDLALVGDLGPVAILERAVFFDGLDGGAGVAEMPELVLELFVSDFDGRLVDLDVFVAVDRESGNDIRRRLSRGAESPLQP